MTVCVKFCDCVHGDVQFASLFYSNNTKIHQHHSNANRSNKAKMRATNFDKKFILSFLFCQFKFFFLLFVYLLLSLELRDGIWLDKWIKIHELILSSSKFICYVSFCVQYASYKSWIRWMNPEIGVVKSIKYKFLCK